MKNERIEKLFEGFTEDIKEYMPKVIELFHLNVDYYVADYNRRGYFDFLTMFNRINSLLVRELTDEDFETLKWLKEAAEGQVRSYQFELNQHLKVYNREFNKNFFTDEEIELLDDFATLEYEARYDNDYRSGYYKHSQLEMSEILLGELHNHPGRPFYNEDLIYFTMDLIDVYRDAFDAEDKKGLVADTIKEKLNKLV